MFKTDRGFCLTEVMILIAIIMILSAIAIPNFMEARSKSRLQQAKADKQVSDNMTFSEWTSRTINVDGTMVSPEKVWLEKGSVDGTNDVKKESKTGNKDFIE